MLLKNRVNAKIRLLLKECLVETLPTGSLYTGQLTFQAVLWGLLGVLWLLLHSYTLIAYPYYALPLLALGLIVGYALGFFIQHRKLKIIEEKGQYGGSFSDQLIVLLLLIGLLMVFFALPWIVPVSFYWNPSMETLGLMYWFIAPILVTTHAASIYLTKKWERKNQKTVLSDIKLFSGRLYAVAYPPQPPHSPP